MTAQAYSNYWNLYGDLGYRLIDYEVYPYGNGYRYAGVWRQQNSSLPNWSLKNDVNALVEAQLNEFNVPCIGVAIIEGGEMRYHGGFGFADIDDNVWYSSRTRNPLASVSKPIGAVLTMQLVEDGVIDLDDLTGSHVASMPNHQTHTLQELLSMRGGVGHYDNHGSVDAQFNTALAGAQFFWNDPLLYTPETSCYYSTHGYTLLGAALEGATGMPIVTSLKVK